MAMELVDGYPDYMMCSIELVEQNREKNMAADIKAMTLEERHDILSKFHPDYMEESKRAVGLSPARTSVNKRRIRSTGLARCGLNITALSLC